MLAEATTRYLDAVDEALPGFVEMLYLTGSVALGAFQPGVSDIDTLIVTSRAPGPDDLVRLAKVHEAMATAGGPHFDGIYLDREAFLRQPADRPVVPFVVDGQFQTDRPCGELTPVLWLTLIRYGLAVRGPAPAAHGFAVDVDALHGYNLDNLQTYWAPLAQQVHHAADAGTDIGAEGVAWCVLGPARLHYTLANHDVISKARAGAYLAELFPAFDSLADRALRWRAGERVGFTAADARAAADSVDAVVQDALRRWG